ncbi:MAG: T9SS type A sorting domain-containing protein [Melioribacteraceae bacterium]|nr:MAG: T9SS type A sorting domain-containing protein [Melioribacteraceae bacterium]
MKQIFLLTIFFTSQIFCQNDWSHLSSTSDFTVNVIEINSDGHIYAGTKSHGIIKSADGGLNWELKNNGLPENEILSILITQNYVLFAGTSGGGMFRSINNGESWEKIEAGLTNTVVTSLIENEDGIIFAGTKGGGVFYSTDNGSNWDEINSGLINKDIIDLAINSAGDLFVGTYSYGVFKLTKENNFWNEINIGMPNNKDILSIIVNKNDDVLAATAYDGIYIREANSLAWQQTALQFFPCRDMALTVTGKVLAATDAAVYISNNGGRSYELFKDGLPNSKILSIASDGYETFYAGAHANGIYKNTSLTSVDKKIIPQNFQLLQNYPNPFNPGTTISFKIHNVEAQHAALLQIYDIIGNKIKTILNEKLPAGIYDINFNADNLPSGVYFYKLQTGAYTQSKKMILMK